MKREGGRWAPGGLSGDDRDASGAPVAVVGGLAVGGGFWGVWAAFGKCTGVLVFRGLVRALIWALPFDLVGLGAP